MALIVIPVFIWALYAVWKTRYQLTGKYELEFIDDLMKVKIQSSAEQIYRIPEDVERVESQGKEPNIYLKNERNEFYVFNPHDLEDGEFALDEYNRIISNKTPQETSTSARA